VTDWSARLEEIEAERTHQELDLLRAEVATLTHRLAQLVTLVDNYETTLGGMATTATTGTGPAPWAWAHLNPEAARRRWVELTAWVDWLNARFRPGARYAIPPCWPRHGAAVEVLSALWESWKAAYLTGGPQAAPSHAPADWFALRLRPLREELFGDPGWLKGCTPTHHEPVPLPLPRPDSNLFAQLLADDQTTSPLPPVPSTEPDQPGTNS
jgi:hypothetical protein